MYSWEIEKYLSDRYYQLTKDEYLEITNLQNSPQICRIKYNSQQDDFQILTIDGYSWIVRLVKD